MSRRRRPSPRDIPGTAEHARRQADQYGRRAWRWYGAAEAAFTRGATDIANVAARRSVLDDARSRVFAGIAEAREERGPGALLHPAHPLVLARYAAGDALTEAEARLNLRETETALGITSPPTS